MSNSDAGYKKGLLFAEDGIPGEGLLHFLCQVQLCGAESFVFNYAHPLASSFG